MGQGIGFPFHIMEHGAVAVSGQRDNIRESVKIILLTEPGERITRPDFGTRLHQFLFEVSDSRLEEMIRREVVHSLGIWEERITDITVEADFARVEEGILKVEVGYRILDTGESDSVSLGISQ